MYKFMIGSDFHFPAQDDKAIDLWFQVMRYWKPDEVDLLGDISDTYEYSRFNMDTHEGFFQKYGLEKNENKEYDVDRIMEHVMDTERPAREFIAENRKARKNATLKVWGGNHDFVRIYNYFSKKYPAVLEHLDVREIYGLDKVKAEYFPYEHPPVRCHGDIHLHHGNLLGTSSTESVKKHMETHLVSMITGHHHRMGQYNKTFNLRGEVLQGWETGHMVDVDHPYMEYDITKNWQQGFTVGFVDDNNRAHVQSVPISPEYTCAVGAKLFSVSSD